MRWLERSEEHTSELQSHHDLVCRLLLEKKNDRGLIVLWTTGGRSGFTEEGKLNPAAQPGPPPDVRKRRSARTPTGGFRARARGVGGAGGVRARLRRIVFLHLPADSGLGGAGRDRCADRFRQSQLLADLDRGRDRGGARGLAVVLGRPQARTAGRPPLAVVAASRADPARRAFREPLGGRRDLHRPLLRTVARLGSAGRRRVPDALWLVPARQFQLGPGLGRRAAHAGRRGGEDFQVDVRLKELVPNEWPRKLKPWNPGISRAAASFRSLRITAPAMSE